jgi:hypothetical protein
MLFTQVQEFKLAERMSKSGELETATAEALAELNFHDNRIEVPSPHFLCIVQIDVPVKSS